MSIDNLFKSKIWTILLETFGVYFAPSDQITKN